MTAKDITAIIKYTDCHIVNDDAAVTNILTDSRKLTEAEKTLFFAIRTKRNNGARYIKDLYNKCVRNFVVCNELDDEMRAGLQSLAEANIWYVKDVVASLQRIAEQHRLQYDMPVVGITGSNGKTIVKDWIVQLLADDYNIVASPKSYNSQIGVPLSVWQMSENNDFAVFEAGISESGEMEQLRNVIQPTIGIFTNIGQAHDENFLTRHQKIAE